MKKILFFVVLALFSNAPEELRAESRSILFLHAYVRPSVATSIKESKLSATQSLWLFSSQMNSRYSGEGQKFEVEGLDQAGIESHIKKIEATDRSIQYEILINRLKNFMPINRPIFLKISAN